MTHDWVQVCLYNSHDDTGTEPPPPAGVWGGLRKLCCIRKVKLDDVSIRLSKVEADGEEEESLALITTSLYAEGSQLYDASAPSCFLFSNATSLLGQDPIPLASLIRSSLPLEDNLIDILVYPSLVPISMQNIQRGGGKRLGQDTGPYRMTFQSTEVSRDIIRT